MVLITHTHAHTHTHTHTHTEPAGRKQQTFNSRQLQFKLRYMIAVYVVVETTDVRNLSNLTYYKSPKTIPIHTKRIIIG